jgi:hypothetical protein
VSSVASTNLEGAENWNCHRHGGRFVPLADEVKNAMPTQPHFRVSATAGPLPRSASFWALRRGITLAPTDCEGPGILRECGAQNDRGLSVDSPGR